jgi:hypothetical protein
MHRELMIPPNGSVRTQSACLASRIIAVEAESRQVEFINERMDRPDEVVLCDPVVEALREEHRLVSRFTLDESCHRASFAPQAR